MGIAVPHKTKKAQFYGFKQGPKSAMYVNSPRV